MRNRSSEFLRLKFIGRTCVFFFQDTYRNYWYGSSVSHVHCTLYGPLPDSTLAGNHNFTGRNIKCKNSPFSSGTLLPSHFLQQCLLFNTILCFFFCP